MTSELLISLIPHAAVAGAVALAAHLDLRSRRIPNWLTGAIALAGLLASGPRFDISLSQSAIGLGIGLAIPFVLFALGMLGAGDAKLIAAIGAWVGPVGIIWVMLFTAIAGAVLAISAAVMQRRASSLLRNTLLVGLNLITTRRTGWASATEVVHEPALQKTTLPYALAILVGLLATQGLMLGGVIA